MMIVCLVYRCTSPEVIGVMVAKMKELNDDGITVWLRYAGTDGLYQVYAYQSWC